MRQKLARRIPPSLACLVASLTMVACGGGGGNSTTEASGPSGHHQSSTGAQNTSTTTTGSSTPAGGPPGSKVGLTSVSDLGQILVDGKGDTLYAFDQDHGGQSSCTGGCGKAWPAFTTRSPPRAGKGIDAAKLDTIEREHGPSQVTYAGHPLYLYSGDAGPGDAGGNGLDQFGGTWHVLDSRGNSP